MTEHNDDLFEDADINRYLSDEALTTIEAVVDAILVNPDIPAEAVDLENDAILWQLSTLINDISAQIQSYIGRNLGLHEYREVKTNAPTEELALDNFPIREVIEVAVYNGASFTKINDGQLSVLTDLSDFKRGTIFMNPVFPSRTRNVGLMGYRQRYDKSIKVIYEAGYVLPKDETDLKPSDLPREIEAIAIKTAREMYIRTINNNKADGLISLQEGNIKREWSANNVFESARFGDLSITDQRVLHRYKVTKALYSV